MLLMEEEQASGSIIPLGGSGNKQIKESTKYDKRSMSQSHFKADMWSSAGQLLPSVEGHVASCATSAWLLEEDGETAMPGEHIIRTECMLCLWLCCGCLFVSIILLFPVGDECVFKEGNRERSIKFEKGLTLCHISMRSSFSSSRDWYF